MLVSIQVKFPDRPEPMELRFEGAERITLGRDASCHVQLPDASVSARHATLVSKGGGYVVFDEQSTNGTLVNGEPIRVGAPRVLSSGDALQLGRAALCIEFSGEKGRGEGLSPSTQDMALAMVRGALLGTGSEVGLGVRVVSGPAAGASVAIEKERTYRVGSASTADLRLPGAAEEHTRISARGSRLWVMDLGAPGGSRLDGRSLQPNHSVSWPPMSVVEVAGHRLCIDDPVSAALRQVESVPDERISEAVRSLSGGLGSTHSDLSIHKANSETHSLRVKNSKGQWVGVSTSSFSSAPGAPIEAVRGQRSAPAKRPTGQNSSWSWVDVLVVCVGGLVAASILALGWFLLMS